jgi:hypothetical protein
MNKFSISFFALVFILCSSYSFSQSHLQSGTFIVNTETEGYTLNKLTGDRSVTKEVAFTKPFDKKPKVVLSVSSLDADSKSNVRYRIEAISVSRDGFTVKLSTWSDSKIFAVTGYWMAYIEE